jgi:hypothetical protein
MVDLFFDKHSPEMRGELEAIEGALNHLSFATNAFGRSSETLRDIGGERRAEEGSAAADDAERMFKTALAGAPPAPAA